MRLHLEPDRFQQFVEATAQWFGLVADQVEKDYHVSRLLKKIALHEGNFTIVFKGGTSLSKCYQLIDRFSEDVDLAVLSATGQVSQSQRRRLKTYLTTTIDTLDYDLLNRASIRSRAVHNQYEIAYFKHSEADFGLRPHILIETIVAYQPFPLKQLQVDNFITTFLRAQNRDDLIMQYGLEPFQMTVQTVERTFVDKLFAICDYHLAGTYNRYSRHLYDVHKIWTSDALNVDEVVRIMPDVIRDRQRQVERNPSCRIGEEPDKILLDVIDTDAYRTDFQLVTNLLVYNAVAYDTVMQSLKDIVNANLIPATIPDYQVVE